MTTQGMMNGAFGVEGGREKMGQPVSKADLAIGMQLLRASNMKAVRFQLALLKRDRRQTLEALDDLVNLDGQIASFLDDMPPAEVSMRELGEISAWIETEKRAIASEKMIVACGAEGPGVQSAAEGPRFGEPLPDDDEDAELKHVVAGIEAHAFDIQPPVGSAPLPAAAADSLRAIEATTRESRDAIEAVGDRLGGLAGRGFIVATAFAVLLTLAALILFAGDIRAMFSGLTLQLRV